MRIPSGVTDQSIYFYGVDANDYVSPVIGLVDSNEFIIWAARDGGAAAAFTTPTVTEVDATNMPGVYALLLDEFTTLSAGNDSEELVLHITQAPQMAPVVRTIELYRPKITAGETLTVSSGAVSTVTTLTGHTPQTGDTFALANGATGFNAIDTVVDSILVDTADMQPKLGTPAADISADIAAVKVDTAAILVDTGTTIPNQITALNDIAATDIVSAGAITTLAGAVVNVDLVDTCTTNTDMRGTDSAALASVCTEGRLAELDAANLPTDIDAILVDTADIQPKIGAPVSSVSADIAAIKAETALIVADTNELQTDNIPGLIGALNDLDAAGVAAATWNAATATYGTAGSYGLLIETNLDAPVSGATAPTAAAVADAVWDELQSGHVSAGSFGEIATEIADILADTGTDGVVVASGSKTGYTLTATTGLGNQTADITGTVSTVTTLTNLPAITANWLTATGTAADAGAKIADIVRRRTQANVEASGDGDTLSVGSLYGLIQQAQESAVSGTTLTVYQTDGTTSLGTKTLVGDPAADPITQIS